MPDNHGGVVHALLYVCFYLLASPHPPDNKCSGHAQKSTVQADRSLCSVLPTSRQPPSQFAYIYLQKAMQTQLVNQGVNVDTLLDNPP